MPALAQAIIISLIDLKLDVQSHINVHHGGSHEVWHGTVKLLRGRVTPAFRTASSWEGTFALPIKIVAARRWGLLKDRVSNLAFKRDCWIFTYSTYKLSLNSVTDTFVTFLGERIPGIGIKL